MEKRRPKPFIQGWSLTLAFLALAQVVLSALNGWAQVKMFGPPDFVALAKSVGWLIGSFLIAGIAAVNLIRDVDHGYCPERSSLAAVILLFAFTLLVLNGLGLATVIERAARLGWTLP